MASRPAPRRTQPPPPADKKEAAVVWPRFAPHESSGALIGAVDAVCSFQTSLRRSAPWPTSGPGTSCSPIAHPRHRHARSRQYGTTSIGRGRVDGGGEDLHGALGVLHGVCWKNTQHRMTKPSWAIVWLIPFGRRARRGKGCAAREDSHPQACAC